MFDSKNIKFYIIFLLSINFYTISFNNNSSFIGFAILFIIITTSIEKKKTLKYVEQ